MRVEENLNGSSERVIRLVLNKDELVSLLDTTSPPVSAVTEKGERFSLCPHQYKSGKFFRKHPLNSSYFLYLGNPSVKGVEGLAKLINERGARIPVLNGNPNSKGYSNGTYVQLVAEMENDGE